MVAGKISNLTASQAALGLLAAASDPEGNGQFFAALWKNGQPGRDVTSALRVAASRFSLRSASGDPQPALVGYLDGMCETYPESSQSIPGDAHAPKSALASQLQVLWEPCAHWPNRTSRSGQYKSGSGIRVMLVLNDADPVSPISLQSLWLEYLGADLVDIEYYSAIGHGHPPTGVEEKIGRFVRSRP